MWIFPYILEHVVWLLCVLLSAESDSSVSCTVHTAESDSRESPAHCWAWLRGVLTAEKDSGESCTPLSMTPRCPASRWEWLQGILHTAEQWAWLRGNLQTTEHASRYLAHRWAVSMTPGNPAHLYDSAVSCPLQSFLRNLVNLPASKFDTAVSCSPWIRIQRCQAHRGVFWVDFKVSCTPRSLTLRCSVHWSFWEPLFPKLILKTWNITA